MVGLDSERRPLVWVDNLLLATQYLAKHVAIRVKVPLGMLSGVLIGFSSRTTGIHEL